MKIALVGNPNCGKTTLFNLLTGSKQRVGNWPGVTVEHKSGSFAYQNKHYDIVDLPGTYSVEPDPIGIAQDEFITRQFLLTDNNSLIVNVIDATNLQRSLYLTFQLIDMQVPMIIVLNMVDALKAMGERLNIDKLTKALGCPVIAISSTRKTGLSKFYQQIEASTSNLKIAMPTIDTLSSDAQAVFNRYLGELPATSRIQQFNRWQLIEALLNGENQSLDFLENEKLAACRCLLSINFDNQIDVALASARYDTIDTLCKMVIDKPREANINLTEKLDKLALGRFTGIPFFLLAMYSMFFIAINFGSVFVDFFEGVFSTIFVDGFTYLLNMLDTPTWLTVILADGVGNGITTVSTFIPVIAAMFFVLSFLEDSGYLARAAMIVDRFMRCIGLPGKAFVPMLMGFGCGVPAIMATRTLDSPRDRILSICLIPFMSCSARLPIYALFAVIFFPNHASIIVFMLYLLGILVAMLTGFILKSTLLQGELTPFIMEMPVYRIPTLRSMLRITFQRLKSFVLRAGKAIVVMVTVLSFFNSLGTDGSFGNENSNHSVLSVMGQKVTPVFTPMGIDKQNWPATVGIFTGIFAKESVVATLNSLYSMDHQTEQPEHFSFYDGIKSALETIPDRFIDLTNSIADPLGLSSINQDENSLRNELSVDSTTVSKISSSFVTSSSAIAYLIFVLLYTPCAAALGTIYRETGLKWMIFVAIWTFVIGWLSATIYYQFSLLGQSSCAPYWLIAIGGFMTFIFIVMRKMGRLPCFNQYYLPKPRSHNNQSACCE
ncbi:MAG: Fe(2+) transporter permease subunit FeoB [Gilliamella apis]|nr:Fe(2+) transporter permease subunit FeoB [Gilliamella apis]